MNWKWARHVLGNLSLLQLSKLETSKPQLVAGAVRCCHHGVQQGRWQRDLERLQPGFAACGWKTAWAPKHSMATKCHEDFNRKWMKGCWNLDSTPLVFHISGCWIYQIEQSKKLHWVASGQKIAQLCFLSQFWCDEECVRRGGRRDSREGEIKRIDGRSVGPLVESLESFTFFHNIGRPPGLPFGSCPETPSSSVVTQHTGAWICDWKWNPRGCRARWGWDARFCWMRKYSELSWTFVNFIELSAFQFQCHWRWDISYHFILFFQF